MGGPVVEEERFYRTYAVRICEGPISDLLKIEEDDKVVYDITPDSQLDPQENVKFAEKFTVYLGTDDQDPDPDLEKIFGVGDTPAYPGTAYIVFPNRDVTDRRGSVPNYRFTVATAGAVKEQRPAIIVGNAILGGESYNSLDIAQQNNNFARNAGLQSFSRDNEYLAVRGATNRIDIYKINNDNLQYELHKQILNTDLHDVAYTIASFDFSPSSDYLAIVTDGMYVHTLDVKNDFSLADTYDPRDSFSPVNAGSSYQQNINGSFRFNPAGNILPFFLRIVNDYYYVHLLVNESNGKIREVSSEWLGQSISWNRNRTVWVNNSTYTKTLSNNTGRYVDLLTGDFTFSYLNNGWGGGFWGFVGKNNSLYQANIYRDESSLFHLELIKRSREMAGFSNSYEVEFDFGIMPSTGIDTSKSSFDLSNDRQYLVLSHGTTFRSDTYNYRYATVFKYNESNRKYEFLEHLEHGTTSNFPTSSNGLVNISQLYGGQSTPGISSVKHIIEDVADRLKINPNILNTENVDIPVRGFVSAEQYTGGNIIRKLQDAYFFDPAEYDGRLNFVPRGQEVKTSIIFDNLVLDSYEFQRNSAIEYPRKIELMYQNPKVGYNAAKATYERRSPEYLLSGTVSNEVPLFLDEDEAAQIADKMLKVAWAEAEGEVNFSLDYSYSYLTPSDTIGFFMRDTQRRLRIEKIETADGILSITAKIDRQSAYSSKVTGVPLPKPTPPPSTIVGDTDFLYLDIPAIIDNHDTLGYYVSGSGALSAWHGGEVQREDLQGEFNTITNLEQGLAVGYIDNDISQASEHYVDTTNKIRVKLYNDVNEPLSVNNDILLQEQNAIAILRGDGSAEILQFRDAEQIGELEYELSYLIRGRLNSQATSHSAGSKFVRLEDVYFIQANANMLDTDLTHRAVSYDQTPDDADIYVDDFVGRNQVEFPISNLRYNKLGPIITLEWSPRERFGSDINPVRSSNWRSYKIVLDDGTKREEIITMENSVNIPVVDFSYPLTATVHQVNRYTGDGPGVSIQIEN